MTAGRKGIRTATQPGVRMFGPTFGIAPQRQKYRRRHKTCPAARVSLSRPLWPLWPVLLVIMALRHYAWRWVPVEHAGMVSKALGSVAALVLLWLLSSYLRPADKLAAWALVLYALHEASAVLCATWFIVAPWPIATGQAMCSAKIGFDLGALGLLLVALLASRGMTQLRSDVNM